VLDIATTTVATNKVKVRELNGKPVQAGWVADERGVPITEAMEAMDVIFRRPGGGMTPLGGPEVTGGHKGYGLGLMVQILSATLTGAAFAPLRSGTRPASEPDDIRHFFLALDLRAPLPDGGFEDDFAAMAGCCEVPRRLIRHGRCCCREIRRKRSTPVSCETAFPFQRRWPNTCPKSSIAAEPITCGKRTSAADQPPGRKNNEQH
jgi:hypothetical protein